MGKGGRQGRPFSDRGCKRQGLEEGRTPETAGGGGPLMLRVPLLQRDLGQQRWVQPERGRPGIWDVPVPSGLGSELASSLSSRSCSREPGLGRGFL